MDDRNLREYALNIFKGIRGYTLSKALSLFPKYYPKIVFYYTEMLTKQQSEFSLRMIQSLGIDKGRALLNELNELNAKMLKFYVDASFKLNESYRRIEAATEDDRYNVIRKELEFEKKILNQSVGFWRISGDLLRNIDKAVKIYNFKSLEKDISKVRNMNFQADRDLYRLNGKFLEYLKRSIHKE